VKKSADYLQEYINYVRGIRKTKSQIKYRDERMLLKRVLQLFTSVKANNLQKVVGMSMDFKLGTDDFNKYNKEGKSLLYYAINNNNHKLVKFLLRHEDPNQALTFETFSDPNLMCCLTTGNYPLHEAFKVDSLFIIQILIKFGADLNHMNNLQQTTTAYGREKTLKYLNLHKSIVSRRMATD